MNLSNEESAVILFGELSSQYVEKCYLYQDLTINFIVDTIKNNNKILSSSGWPDRISEKAENRRLRQVNDFYGKCAGLLTMSQWLCDYMKKSGVIAPEKVHCVGGGCNIDISKINFAKKQGNKFLFVGKDFKCKNGGAVIKAFNMLHKKYPEIKLYIAGPKTKEECGELGEGIVFLGRLSYEDLIEYYNLCDYFVMPSNFEAYGLAFGEALCFGLPCIGKNVFAMPEFIQENNNGYLVKTDSVKELADKMEKIINNKEMVQRVQDDNDVYISKYSWDAVAERIFSVIENQHNIKVITK